MKDLLKKLLRNTLIASAVIGWAGVGMAIVFATAYLIAEKGMWYFAIPVAVVGAGIWGTGIQFAAEKWGR